MIVGDSISQGSAGDYTWRYRLWKHLESTAPGVVDFVGDRTVMYDNVAAAQGSQAYADGNFDRDHHALWGRAAWQEKDTIAGAVGQYRPKVICLFLGTNDVAWGATPQQSFADLQSVITNARQGRADIQIIVGHIMTRYDFFEGVYKDGPQVAEFNRLVDTLPGSMGTAQSPIRIAATDSGWDAKLHTWDGTHPSSTGEVRLAGAFADSLGGWGIGGAYGPRNEVFWPGRPSALSAASTGAVPGPTDAPVALGVHTGADLRWGQAVDATGYLIRLTQLDARLPVEVHLPHAVGATEFPLRLLAGDGLYRFGVVAVNDRGKNRLSWPSVPGATGYLISVQDITGGEAWKTLPYPVQTTVYEDQVLHPEHVYEYMIRPTKGVMEGMTSPSASVMTRRFGPFSGYSSTVRVKWDSGRRHAMVDFARHWGAESNEAEWTERYGFLDENDCTHFVSEGLLAAGFAEKGDPGSIKRESDFTVSKWWRTDDSAPVAAGGQWPQLRRNASYTFTVAQDLRDHLLGSREADRVSEAPLLDYGDLIFFDWDANGQWDHVSVVTGFDAAGWPLYSQHSPSRSNANLRERVIANPEWAMEYWHIAELNYVS